MKDQLDRASGEFKRFSDIYVKQEPNTNVWKRSSEFQKELEEFGIECLKAMRKEVKSSSSNGHERLYAISAAFQRVMEVLPIREV